MAAELVAGTSQLLLMPLNTERLKQFCTSIAGELHQVAAHSRGVLVICNISDRRPRGNHTKPLIESRKLAQKRLEGRLTQPSFLWTRRILERLQAIQNQ